MIKIHKILTSTIVGLFLTSNLFAGNPDRVGQAGVSQLLVFPWARSGGWAASNNAGVSGVEAMSLNVAGIGNIHKTEFNFTNMTYLGGDAGVKINAFGLTQKLGEDDAIGLTLSSFDLGDIPLTSELAPDQTLGTYNVSILNIALGYSHRFSNAISTGVLVRLINEGINNATASGVAFDAGIQYATSDNDRLKFGINLKNIGSEMSYSGSGLSKKATIDGTEYSMTLQSRNEQFELPSQLQIGGSYDFFLGGGDDSSKLDNILTFAGQFNSNAFDNDQGRFGLQYGWKKMLFLRVGYTLEKNIWDKEKTYKAYTGPAAGVTVQLPFGPEKKRLFAIDYAYQQSGVFNGTHAIGVRIGL